MFMKKTVIKRIIKITISVAAIIAAYKFGKEEGYDKGYDEGWADREMEAICNSCLYHDDELECCTADVPDFDNICP